MSPKKDNLRTRRILCDKATSVNSNFFAFGRRNKHIPLRKLSIFGRSGLAEVWGWVSVFERLLRDLKQGRESSPLTPRPSGNIFHARTGESLT